MHHSITTSPTMQMMMHSSSFPTKTSSLAPTTCKLALHNLACKSTWAGAPPKWGRKTKDPRLKQCASHPTVDERRRYPLTTCQAHTMPARADLSLSVPQSSIWARTSDQTRTMPLTSKQGSTLPCSLSMPCAKQGDLPKTHSKLYKAIIKNVLL